MKNLYLILLILVSIDVTGQISSSSCPGLNFDFTQIMSEIDPIPLLPGQFVIEGDVNKFINGIEIINAGDNGLVICSPGNAGIYATGGQSYSAYLTNDQNSIRPAVLIGHGDETKMDLQFNGVGRTAGEDGYVINVDTNQDGDESFVITEGGGVPIFEVSESEGTFTKDLDVNGKAQIDSYLSINGGQNANAFLSLKRGNPVLGGSRNLISLDGNSESWIMYIDLQTGNLCFEAESGAGVHCFSNTSSSSNVSSTSNKIQEGKNAKQEKLNTLLLERIVALEQEIKSIKG